MFYRVFMLSLISLLDCSVYARAMAPCQVLGDRPESIQRKIDQVFDRFVSVEGNTWKFNGTDGFYHLLLTDDARIIREIASRVDGKSDVYFMDVGAAFGQWGIEVEELLKSEFSQSDKHFHIISLTGSNELIPDIATEGNISHYRFDKFKIENIDAELQKRGLNLDGKVDLIVSRWTLRHLVDPFGTLKQLYSFLSVGSGVLMSNGFLINRSSFAAFWKILPASHARVFFDTYSGGGEEHSFFLNRPDHRPLDLPIAYTDTTVQYNRFSDQCEAEEGCRYAIDDSFGCQGALIGEGFQFRVPSEFTKGLKDLQLYYGDKALFIEFHNKGWFREDIGLPVEEFKVKSSCTVS